MISMTVIYKSGKNVWSFIVSHHLVTKSLPGDLQEIRKWDRQEVWNLLLMGQTQFNKVVCQITFFLVGFMQFRKLVRYGT